MFGNPPPPVLPNALDACAMLPALRSALYNLMAGKTRQQTRDGDKWSSWHAGNVRELKAEIRKLEQECGLAFGQGRAVQAGPRPIPNGMFPFRPRGWGSRY